MSRKILATLILVIATAGGLNLALAQSKEEALLESRAHAVFAYSKSTGALPAHLVRRLSLAMTFHDYDGAAKLVRAAEAQIRK